MSAIAIEPQTAITHYARDRERYSLVEMKRLLGDARAIELEIQYQGEELKEIAAMALVQVNRILVALNKPELTAWPKGELSGATPLEVALGFQTYDASDLLSTPLWWVDFRSSDFALGIAQQTNLDVYDDRGACVLTVRQAGYRLSDEKYGPHEKLGLALDESLSEFCGHWMAGLYPTLVEKGS